MGAHWLAGWLAGLGWLSGLQGEGGDHLGLRCRVMDYIQERQEEYQFFM